MKLSIDKEIIRMLIFIFFVFSILIYLYSNIIWLSGLSSLILTFTCWIFMSKIDKKTYQNNNLFKEFMRDLRRAWYKKNKEKLRNNNKNNNNET